MTEKHYIYISLSMTNFLKEEFTSFKDMKEKRIKLAKMLKEQALKTLEVISDEDFLERCTKTKRYFEREVPNRKIKDRVYY